MLRGLMSTTKQKVRVAQLSALGNLTEVNVFGDATVLLAKVNGEVRAVGAKCTHYGAPLKNGVLTKDGCITCPWHAARFDTKTGDIEDAPAVKSIKSFPVQVDEHGDVYILASEEDVKDGPRDICSVPEPSTSSGGVVIVGGGASGLTAAESLRQSGYKGNVTIYTTEPNLPLDRTKLSKAFIGDASKLEWLTKEELTGKLKVSVRHIKVVGVDKTNKRVQLQNGEDVGYDKLVLATGAFPSKLPIKGADLDGVFVLRNIEHVRAINEALGDKANKHVVLLGGSFIGMEAATGLLKKAASVTVIEPSAPLAAFGKQIADRLVALHEEKGVKFLIGHGSVQEFKAGQGGAVGSAKLDNGSTIPADVVILATGVKPQTQWLADQFKVEKDGGIDVNEFLQVKGEEDVYAIGDIARFKHPGTETFGRIEHYNVAQNHGRTAGRHIAGRPRPFQKVPFFWTAQQGKQVRYAGHATDYEDIVYQGSLEELTFAAYFVKGESVQAVVTVGKDPIAAQSLELLRLGKMPSTTEIKSGKSPLDVAM